MRTILGPTMLLILLSVLAPRPAAAQWAVIDVQAIAQLIQQVQTLQQQLLVAQGQLQQARQSFTAMTGPRGMQSLLGGINRNYLPTSSGQLAGVFQGSGGAYPALARDAQGAVSANAVLSPAQLATLAPADQAQIIATRRAAALRQSIAQQALANSSARFASLQTLIASIGTAQDQKAILDLQARISAELAMLANEQTKLQILAQALQAQEAANSARQRETALAEQGQFATRFRPSP
jgi:type IV secretion system protein VirB5